MDAVRIHYATLLAPIYSWMAGGAEPAFARGEAELESLRVTPRGGAIAVDLGAGFGMHAIPLARRGFSVLAVDSSADLLRQLRAHAGALTVRTAEADLLEFPEHVPGPPEVILCMGDTLAHLASTQAIATLFARVAATLVPGGVFVLTFRDYSTPLAEERRFIPVKSDADRILTCFLEYGSEHVDVYDLLYERRDTQWTQRVSRYTKLRLTPGSVSAELHAAGFQVTQEAGPGGMVRLRARTTASSS